MVAVVRASRVSTGSSSTAASATGNRKPSEPREPGGHGERPARPERGLGEEGRFVGEGGDLGAEFADPARVTGVHRHGRGPYQAPGADGGVGTQPRRAFEGRRGGRVAAATLCPGRAVVEFPGGLLVDAGGGGRVVPGTAVGIADEDVGERSVGCVAFGVGRGPVDRGTYQRMAEADRVGIDADESGAFGGQPVVRVAPVFPAGREDHGQLGTLRGRRVEQQLTGDRWKFGKVRGEDGFQPVGEGQRVLVGGGRVARQRPGRVRRGRAGHPPACSRTQGSEPTRGCSPG